MSDTPTELDEAVRTFKGYVLGENGFDELDFKEWLINWHEQEITKARIDENMRMRAALTGDGIHNGDPMDFTYDRIRELSHTLKEMEAEL